MQGKLICIEGGDGCGKTTTLRLVKKWAKKQSEYPIIFTKEPAGTQLGTQIRRILINPNYSLSKTEQAYLFAVARRDHIRHVIAPALKRGKIIICDRYLLSSLAYQGRYKATHPNRIKQFFAKCGFCHIVNTYRDVNHVMKINLKMISYHRHIYLPDLNIYLRLDPRTEVKRLNGRRHKRDKFDKLMSNVTPLMHLQHNYEIAMDSCEQQFGIKSTEINANLKPEQRAKAVIHAIKHETKIGRSLI